MIKTSILASSAALCAFFCFGSIGPSWQLDYSLDRAPGWRLRRRRKLLQRRLPKFGKLHRPDGGVWHHSGNAHQVAPGQWAGERTIVGPGGQTWQNSWDSAGSN